MGKKIYTNELGHLAKMAAMVKIFKNLLLQNQLTVGNETW